MQDSKFLTLFRRLESPEVPAFYKYLKQQHGEDTIALRVFEYVRKFYPDRLDDKKLELTYAYRVLFRAELSEKGVDRRKMLNTLSDLHLHLKDFLLCEKVRNDALEGQALWLGILQERGLHAEFSRQATDFYETVKGTPQKNVKALLRDLLADYFHHHHRSLSRVPEDTAALQAYLDTLHTCAETIRLKITCEIRSLLELETSPNDLAQPAKPPEPTAMEKAPLFRLYREVHQLLEHKSEAHFDQIGVLLREHAKDLDPLELHEILKYMYNYGAKFVRNGDEIALANKLHPFNTFAEQHGFFKQKDVMTPIGFTNIVNVACAAKDFEWAAAFVKKYGHLMSDPVVTLAQAVILFDQTDFDKVIDVLGQKTFRDVPDAMRARLLILRSYHGRGEDIDRILNYCGSFEGWLRRHQDTKPGPVAGVRAFLHLFKLLLLEETNKATLLARIESTPNMYCRTWLRNQASNYKGKYAPRKRNQ